MQEPNIHYYSLRHRDRVIKMQEDYLATEQVVKSRKIINQCLGVALFTLLVLVETWIIGTFA